MAAAYRAIVRRVVLRNDELVNRHDVGPAPKGCAPGMRQGPGPEKITS